MRAGRTHSNVPKERWRQICSVHHLAALDHQVRQHVASEAYNKLAHWRGLGSLLPAIVDRCLNYHLNQWTGRRTLK